MKRASFIIHIILLLFNTTIAAQCIDFTDLESPLVRCTYGSYSNPYYNTGIINYGPSSGNSRHTVHTDVNEVDWYTEGQLHTVPPGEKASVRLGNWRTDAQAESITYEYKVNNEENPILVFKYAAVMEDPAHDAKDQPRLTLAILDENNNMIDNYCGAFDFIANPNLGWNTTSSGILWKDWTSVGLDLSAYDGQTVYIRLTTYDCNHGGHFGYAYLNISCQKKEIKSLTCGFDQVNTYTVPDGFEYQWYTLDGNTKNVVSTEQAISVSTDAQTYYCDAHQIGKPTCVFTLSVIAEPRLPLANFQYKRQGTCVDELSFENLSAVSKDGISPNSQHEDCDEYIWDLGDGRKVYTKNIDYPITYKETGTYKVKLTAKLTEGNCEHTYEEEIFVHGENDPHLHITYDTICSNGYVMFDNERLDKNGTYTHIITTSYGCDSTSILHLHVNPAYHFNETAAICDYETYTYRGKEYSQTDTYTEKLSTSCNCDSIYELLLTVTPTKRDTTYATICANDFYTFAGEQLNKSGTYSDTTYQPTSAKCEIQTLNLTVSNPTVITSASVGEVCANNHIYHINCEFEGPKPLYYSLFYDEKAKEMGFIDVINAPFSSSVVGEIPQLQGNTYLRPDTYNVRLEFNNGSQVCDATDFAQDITFLVKYPSWIIEQNWNDVVALLNQDYNGGYRFRQVDWFVNDYEVEHNAKTYLYAPNNLHQGDVVYAQLTREGEDYAVCTCPVVMEDKSKNAVSQEPVLITILSKQRQIVVYAQEDIQCNIFDTYGSNVYQAVIHSQEEVTISLHSFPIGMYVVSFTGQHNRKSYKIFLE